MNTIFMLCISISGKNLLLCKNVKLKTIQKNMTIYFTPSKQYFNILDNSKVIAEKP